MLKSLMMAYLPLPVFFFFQMLSINAILQTVIISRDPDYPWDAYLQSQRSGIRGGGKEPVCPDEPQNRLTSLARSLKAPPFHLYPETPLEKPPNNPKILG
jgi:hypothetical protein